MALNVCYPWLDQCLFGYANTESGFRFAVLQMMAAQLRLQYPDELGRINGTFNGANQEIVPAAGVGLKTRVRTFFVNTGDANTDWQVFSRTGGGVNTAVTPNYDFLNNAGVMAGVNTDGWFESGDNESLVITSNNPVDVLGTYVILPA